VTLPPGIDATVATLAPSIAVTLAPGTAVAVQSEDGRIEPSRGPGTIGVVASSFRAPGAHRVEVLANFPEFTPLNDAEGVSVCTSGTVELSAPDWAAIVDGVEPDRGLTIGQRYYVRPDGSGRLTALKDGSTCEIGVACTSTMMMLTLHEIVPPLSSLLGLTIESVWVTQEHHEHLSRFLRFVLDDGTERTWSVIALSNEGIVYKNLKGPVLSVNTDPEHADVVAGRMTPAARRIRLLGRDGDDSYVHSVHVPSGHLTFYGRLGNAAPASHVEWFELGSPPSPRLQGVMERR
jgi:hypothetical protein